MHTQGAGIAGASRGRTALALVAAGGCATLAQVAVVRELLVLAGGSELAAGLALAAWLLASGVGAMLGGRLIRRASALPALLATCAPLLPAAVLLVRLSRSLLPVAPGEVVALPLVMAAGLSAAPFCVVAGAIFPAALRASTLSVAAAYGLEALGAAVGGLAFILIAGRLSQLELALAAAAVLAAAALLTAAPPARSRPQAFAAALSALLVAGLWLERAPLERISRAWQWPRWQVVASLDSPYGNLTTARAARSSPQLDVFASGLWAFSCTDDQAAEQALLPLLAHPAPRRVLVLGLPAPLTLKRLLAYPGLKELTCVELDPALPRLLAPQLPARDPRLALICADPRQWVESAPAASFDAVLLAAAEPRSAAGSRLWSAEFFARLRRLLAPGGVLAFSAHAAPNAAGPLEADYLACLARSAAAAGKVSVLPASGALFLAGEGRAATTEAMAARLADLKLETRYVTPYYLRYEVSALRAAALRTALAESHAAANTDLAPRCFYFNAMLWSGQHAAWLKALYGRLAGLPAVAFAALPLAPLALFPASLALARRSRRRVFALFALAAVGFNTMAAQVALLVLFQVAHGSLYLQLALLVASFMAGLGAGSGLAAARPARGAQAVASALALAALTAGLALESASLLAAPAWAFALLAAACGALAGYAFPALTATLSAGGEPERAGGLAYGAELAGSAAGGVLASLIIIPLANIPAAFWAAAMAGAGAALAAGLGGIPSRWQP